MDVHDEMGTGQPASADGLADRRDDGAEDRSVGDRGRPRSVAFAAAFLALIGVSLTLLGTFTMVALAGVDCSGSFVCLEFQVLAIIWVVIAGVGVLHVATGVGIWRGRGWSRVLGAVLALLGTAIVSAIAIGAAVIPSDVALIVSGVLLVAYLTSVVGLWRWYLR